MLRRGNPRELDAAQGPAKNRVPVDKEPVVTIHLLAPISFPGHVHPKEVTPFEPAADTIPDDFFEQYEAGTAGLVRNVKPNLRHVVDIPVGKSVMKGDNLAIQLEKKERKIAL